MNDIGRTRVKICGITSLEDAMVAVEAGADAIGLVFYEKSPRYVAIDTASRIVNSVPPFINCTGLFVDADKNYIREILKQVSIDTLQFHGQEMEHACTLYGKPYIKAIRMSNDVDLVSEIKTYASARALLLDTFVKDTPGGTGISFDWDKIPKDLTKPIILAGGLDINNVKQAITKVKPYAVDVSGGVETEKGKKDPNKIINFIREVNECRK
ncbi:MAG: phosphoribosylanthranilate isomerase [Proteobacteria bacterium]|nr:phosphoribosylanthranilate isomerase [Pseudomonadota bacterium]